MTSTLISIRDLSYSQPSAAHAAEGGLVKILKDIALDIPSGQTLSIVGPSGSGKTSLMMLMAGLEAPTSGDISIAGQNLGEMNEDELARFRRDNIGIVFQDFHLIPTMTALENVSIPLEFARVPDARKRAEKCLEDVGLGHRMDHLPSQLSGGEQQRVALARAFAVAPKLLLADEPTGNLDTGTGAIITDLLFEMQRQHNTTLVLITHDPALAERCNRTITIRDGEVISDTTETRHHAEPVEAAQ
ncbi:ABC transporter ATP-binding protein [Kiloniella sp. b19]|uniref:ABC transporter ATP-binding protein n=1 Tax=Kiloniella sp. GXU_MW_B19 TaxID=3141326 RepID=UPI0031E0E454